MENLKIGDGPLRLNALVRLIEGSPSYPKLLGSWEHFARHLGVNEAKLLLLKDQVAVNIVKRKDVLYEIFSFWVADKGEKAALKVLCDALVNSQIREIADLLEKEYWLVAIKSFKINLIENPVRLEEILGNATAETYKRIYNALKNISYNQPLPLLKEDVIPKVEPNYYVPRTLSYMNQVDESIFKSTNAETSTFLVKGIGKHELAKACGFEPVDVSGNQFEEITVRFIVLEWDEDFDRICKRTENHVHLIEHRNGSYFWIKSSSGIDTVQRFLLKNKTIFDEDNLTEKLVSTPPQSVSISDSPGMGKSFLMASLAWKVKIKGDSIGIHIILNEFSRRVSQPIDSVSAALEAITEYASSNEISKLILDTILKNETHNFDLFLDGYDEVIQDHPRIDSFLKYMREMTQFRILVTTRPHMRYQLENVLNVLSYEILPFDESNQTEFLSKYWVDLHGANQGELVRKFAKQSLQTLQGQMTDKEQEIAGVPLQCRMLAEVLGDDAERASKVEVESTHAIRITSLFDMYKALVHVKFKRVPEEPRTYFSAMMPWFSRNGNKKDNYVKAHVRDSIQLLFPDWIDIFRPHLNGFQQIDLNTLFSIGLIEKSLDENTPRFVHRTFAEYLLAEYLVKNVSQQCESVQLLFSNVLGGEGVYAHANDKTPEPAQFKLKYPVIAYFVNMHLKDQIKESPLDELSLKISMYRHKIQFENVCKAMAVSGAQNLETSFSLAAELFRHLYSDHDNPEYLKMIRDKYFRYLPHLAVAASGSDALIKNVLNSIKQVFKVDLNYHNYETDNVEVYPWVSQCTPLHLAVYFGKYNIFTNLLREYGDRIEYMKRLMHMCTFQSSSNSDTVVQDKLSIIEILAAEGRRRNLNWLNELQNDRTPLLENMVHIRLIQRLVMLGADINTGTKYGTVLHTSSDVEDFKDLLGWSLSTNFKLINFSDFEGKTPVMKAMERSTSLNEDILELFHKAGAEFDIEDCHGNSVLLYAAMSQNTTVISKILDYGANVNHENKNKWNAAHFTFSDRMRFDPNEALHKLSLMLSKGFKLLNQPNLEGATPFMTMMRKIFDYDIPVELFQLFHSHGVDFNEDVMFITKQPVLFHTLCLQSQSSVAKIIECGANLNHEDDERKNAAHAIIRNAGFTGIGSAEIIKWMNLIISGGFHKIDQPDIKGITPLHLAMGLKNIDPNLIEFFHKRGVNFNAKDNEGCPVILKAISSNQNVAVVDKLMECGAYAFNCGTNDENVLHLAFSRRLKVDSTVLKLLFQKVGINSVDKNGRTPLHYFFIESNRNRFLPSETNNKNSEFLQFCHENRANFNAIDGNGDSVLFIAIHSSRTQEFWVLKGDEIRESLRQSLQNDMQLISSVIQLGGDVNHVNKKMENAAHVAIKNWDLNSYSTELIHVFKIFMQNGFTRMDEPNGQDETSLVLSLKQSSFGQLFNRIPSLSAEYIKLLDFFRLNEVNFNAEDANGNTSLLIASRLTHSVHVMERMIKWSSNVNHVNKKNENAGLLAIQNHNFSRECVQVFQLLFQHGFSKIDEANTYGETALLFLVLRPLECVDELLQLFFSKGANFNVTNKNGVPALFIALCSARNSVIPKLLEYGADLYYQTITEKNALHYATLSGNCATVKLVIDKFDVNSVNIDGWTPLHYLFSTEGRKLQDPTLLELFHARGFNFNANDNEGSSILLYAIKSYQYTTIISQLLKYGTDPSKLNPYNANVFHIAAYCRNSPALNLFFDSTTLDVNSVDLQGLTPLHYLVLNENSLDQTLLGLFHSKRADFNAANTYGSVLFSAIRGNQNATIISKIIEYGGDPFYLNTKNNNALLIAACYANVSALEYLLETFDDINAVDDDGDTPLHEVFSLDDRDYCDVLKLLLKYNPKFDIKNKDGYFPLVRWIIQGKNPIPTLLELQDLLPINSEIASGALNALVPLMTLHEEYPIDSTKQDKKLFSQFFDLLIHKGAKLKTDGSSLLWKEQKEETETNY